MNDPFSTSHYIKRGLYVFLSIVAIGLVVATVRYFLSGEAGVSNPSELDFGLEDTGAAVLSRPTGYLHMYGAAVIASDELSAEEQEAITPELFTVKLADGSASVAPLYPAAAEMGTDDFVPGFFTGRNDEAVGTIDEYHPAWVNYVNEDTHFFESPSLWNEGDVQIPGRHLVNEERPWVAYDGQTTQVGEEDYENLAHWQIVLRNEYTHETRIIEEAARPVWINDGADLLYIKDDGVYRYNVAADASDLVDGSWHNLSHTTRLAAADDNSALVMTVPGLNTIAVYTFTDAANGELQLQGMIADERVTYTAPVFSPDNRLYAVLAFNESDLDETTNRYRTGRVEFRSVTSREVVEVFVPQFDFAKPVALLDWRAKVEPYEWR